MAPSIAASLASSTPSFAGPRTYAVGSYATNNFPSSVAIGDLNGDGKLDLATGNIGNTVSVFLNRGDGSFQAKVDYGTGRIPSSIAIGDLTGDRGLRPDSPSSGSADARRDAGFGR